MTRYRDHRGGLPESMATQREVACKSELIAYLRPELAPLGFEFADDQMRIEPYGGDDDRIGWKDVHIVVIEGFGPVAFVEGNLP